MNSTYLGLQDALGSKLDLAQGYYWDEQTKTHKTMPFMPLDDISGAGAVISTVTDYTKWIKCLLTEAAPFSKAVHEDIRTPRSIFVAQASPERDVQLYGLGWYRTLVYGKVLYTHDGTTLSTTASIYWLPELNYGVVAFTNILNPALRVLLVRLVEDKLGIPADERFNLTDAQVLRFHLVMEYLLTLLQFATSIGEKRATNRQFHRQALSRPPEDTGTVICQHLGLGRLVP